ncbi:hypothetical protein [Halotalea alkalilenta]|uniref:hypothetical protein n=1 Tax=Halotalea alkalilenta TaxID=376489 RepID=UPI000487F3C8|nr:hypothetical protein [Halotalea alkalilenta]
MSFRRILRAPLIVAGLLGGGLLLGGCQTLSGPSNLSHCALSSVPTLVEDQCLVHHWIAFADQSQEASEAWRSTIAQRLASSTSRDRLVRAVAFTWSSDPSRLTEARRLYAEALEQAPQSLRPLLQLWQDDLGERLAAANASDSGRAPAPASPAASATGPGVDQAAARIAALEQENAELRRKLDALANIEAMMNRRYGE